MACKPVTTSMHGKTCVITGANTGIGKSAAEALASLGARVVMVCRDRGKGERARDAVHAAAARGGNDGSAELLIADLSSQLALRAMTGELLAAYPVVDVLVNNAGVALKQRELTVDGIERTFAVNYLAYFMLANLLLPALAASPGGRIVNVASAAHTHGELDFDNLQGERRYRNYPMYAASKLQDVMLTYALARRLRGTRVTVNALHPGVVATEIWRQLPVFDALTRWFMLSPEKGARTTVYLAASPEVGGVTGGYFDKCRTVHTSVMSYDEEMQDRLWDMSVKLTGVGGTIS